MDKLALFAISQQLYTLLDRKKQIVFVNYEDFTLLFVVSFCSDTQNISS
jgi:hypothetical protein